MDAPGPCRDRSAVPRDDRPALDGQTFTETFAGRSAPSVRAVTPITDQDGKVVGLVAAGVPVANISTALVPRLGSVVVLALAVVAVSALFSWLLSRYLGRVTAGRGPRSSRGSSPRTRACSTRCTRDSS